MMFTYSTANSYYHPNSSWDMFGFFQTHPYFCIILKMNYISITCPKYVRQFLLLSLYTIKDECKISLL